MNADRTVLTDAMWQRIEDMLPGKATDPGVTAADNRQFIEGVLWQRRTGLPWRELPERFGKWNSVFKRFRRWEEAGVFERVFKVLSEEFDFDHIFAESAATQRRRKAAGANREPGIRESDAPGGA